MNPTNLAILLWTWSSLVFAVSTQDGFALLRVFPEMQKIWNPKNIDLVVVNDDRIAPCTHQWKYLSCSNNKVTQLFLGNRNLTYIVTPLIPNLNLVTLELQNNRIRQEIPSELGQLSGLVSLNLSNNNFFGNIPDSLTSLTSLASFDVTNNNLSGNVPTKLQSFPCDSFTGNPNLNGISSSTQCLSPNSPSSTTSSKSKSSNLGLIIGSVCAVLFLLVLSVFVLLSWRRRKKIASSAAHKEVRNTELENTVSLRFYGQLRRYSLSELLTLTNGFSENKIIGKGGFGTVFIGHPSDDKTIAIKRLRMEEKFFQGKEFLNELEVLSHAVHKNILQIEGFCVEKHERVLIFPFMPNGSVSDYFIGGSRRKKMILSWKARQKIAIGTAEGLAYMHNDCNPKLIHRDVKAANILLDDRFEPFVADFGLAKLVNLDHTHVTTKVRGTIGHIAPECFQSGKASEKSDVYSFGVFLVELISGCSTLGIPEIDEENITLHDYVLRELNCPGLGKLVDRALNFKELLKKSYDTKDLEGQTCDAKSSSVGATVQHMLYLAMLCLKISPNHRPTMAECVSILKSDINPLEVFDRRDELHSLDDLILRSTSIPRSGSIPHSGDGFHFSDVSVEAFALSGPR